MGGMESVTGNEGCHIIIVKKNTGRFQVRAGERAYSHFPALLLNCDQADPITMWPML